MFQLSKSYSNDIGLSRDSQHPGTVITSVATSSHIAVSTTDNLVHVVSTEGEFLYSINTQNAKTGHVTAISIIDGGVMKSGHGLLILGYSAIDGEMGVYGLESRYAIFSILDENRDIPSDNMRLSNMILNFLLIPISPLQNTAA
jgi:hypothetical protein